MFLHKDENGSQVVILDNEKEVLTVELPGGNGEYFVISGVGTVTDEDGFDLTQARLHWCG
jgi:hypothetical protein